MSLFLSCQGAKIRKNGKRTSGRQNYMCGKDANPGYGRDAMLRVSTPNQFAKPIKK
jgi:hypothetical protein